MKLIFSIIFIFHVFIGFSQSDTLNKYNEKGKKHGYWLVKLDSTMCPTQSDDFSFYAYERYDNGTAILKIECIKYSPDTRFRLFIDKYYSKESKIISGKMRIYSKDGILVTLQEFEKGIPKKFEYHYWGTDTSIHSYDLFDFNQNYRNEDGSWKFEHIANHGHNEYGWYRNGDKGWKIYFENIPETKYPYVKNYAPPLIALQLGYDFIQKNQIEISTIINLSDNYDIKFGMLFGPIIGYKRILDSKINTFHFGIGFISPVSLGFELNYNFQGTEHLMGFKPFIGTSFYNCQLLYGYNFFRNSRNENLNLSHHSLTFRIAIPVKLLKNYLD